MRFQLPKSMLEKGTDAVSVNGTTYAVDVDGGFNGPDTIAKDVKHLGITAAIEPAKVVEKKPEPAAAARQPYDGPVEDWPYAEMGQWLKDHDVDPIPAPKVERVATINTMLAEEADK